MGLTIEGSAMAAGIGGCLLLSGLFFYLAAGHAGAAPAGAAPSACRRW